MANEKYEITDIAHERYPFLRRIRALRDIGDEVKAGDLGGFVESETNLSFEQGDDAWIFNDAIVAGEAVADKNSVLRGDALACGCAYVSNGSVMSGRSRAEDDAYLSGATMLDDDSLRQRHDFTGRAFGRRARTFRTMPRLWNCAGRHQGRRKSRPVQQPERGERVERHVHPDGKRTGCYALSVAGCPASRHA